MNSDERFTISAERQRVDAVVAHPDLKNLRNFILATRDAHELYQRYGGYEQLANPERWMARPRL